MREQTSAAAAASPIGAQLARGAGVVELLKQPQYHPMPVEQQIAIIYAVTNGHLDDVPVEKIREWEEDFHEFMDARQAALLREIRTGRVLSEALEEQLKAAIAEYKELEQ